MARTISLLFLFLFCFVAAGSGHHELVRAQGLQPKAIGIGWSPFGKNPTSYRVLRNGTQIATITDVTALSYVDTGLTPATSYTYEVESANADGTTISGGFATAQTLPAAPLLYQTTFEEDTPIPTALIGGWVKISANPNAISATTERRRAGGQAVKFNFQRIDWQDNNKSNRAQMQQFTTMNLTASTLGQDYWVGISTYLDPSWLPDHAANGELIWQFHGQSDSPAAGGTPPVALYIHGNVPGIAVNADPVNCYPYNARVGPTTKFLATFSLDDLKGQWVDWVIRVKFDVTNGRLDVWKNGTRVVAYTGSTIYNWCTATRNRGPYLTFGPYKWYWGTRPTQVTSRIMFIDEVRIGGSTATCKDVKPTGSNDCM